MNHKPLPEKTLGELISKNSGSMVTETATVIDNFFSPLTAQAKKEWPFDFKSEGWQTEYRRAELLPSRDALLKPGEGMKISAILKNKKESFFMEQSFYFDEDKLSLRLERLYRIGFGRPTGFAALAVRKFKAFIDAQDAGRQNGKAYPSQLELEAVSNNDKSRTAALGGYVWANTGFEFADSQSRNQLRERFCIFARSHGVLLGEKDMKYFTQPCHFAAFDCGKSVADKFGGQSTLGKAFMLYESWDGVMLSGKNKGEAAAYAKLYNNSATRSEASKVLNKAYRSVVNKYKMRYGFPQMKETQGLKPYLRLMTLKFSRARRF